MMRKAIALLQDLGQDQDQDQGQGQAPPHQVHLLVHHFQDLLLVLLQVQKKKVNKE